ncbi:unnamed protein product [Effrenium voratum]|uniref:Uncharacterized protein n=2 Tax=Effrenium voratum TaxID=2562239 RepID=A0AA36IJI0_9DINO|nr:unnamed protein product [Effrenium voratum]CAJ1388948.1 unnamed protein product [Effrenium voratum]CAJ1420851.1 unnamed protein product [Effrenium voratum]
MGGGVSAVPWSVAFTGTLAAADGPIGTITTTDAPLNCGCSVSSFILLRGESNSDPVIRKSDTSFGNAAESVTSSASQDACEASLLNSATAVAYGYSTLSKSCVLLREITQANPEEGLHSGAKMQEFPWLCGRVCTAAADPRWTNNVIQTSFHSFPACQCCYNEDFGNYAGTGRAYYQCSSSDCQVCTGDEPWSTSYPTTSETKSLQVWSLPLALAAFFSQFK